MPHDHPRLELLKQQASQMGLTRDQVREFGSLTRRATWESAIAFRRATSGELDRWNESDVNNVIHKSHSTSASTTLLSFPQLLALTFLVVGVALLILPSLQRIRNPLPIKITIQVGLNK